LRRQQHVSWGASDIVSDEGEGEGSDVSSSEEEDEEGEELTPAMEVQILRTINSIRERDPKIYQHDMKWFSNGEDEEAEGKEGRRKGERPKRYKDVIREQVLAAVEADKEAIESSEEEDLDKSGAGGERGGEPVSSQRMGYDAEQLQLRQAFLEAAAGEEEGEGAEEEEEEKVEKEKEAGRRRKKGKAGGSSRESVKRSGLGEEEEEEEKGGDFEGTGLLKLRRGGEKEGGEVEGQIKEEVERMMKTRPRGRGTGKGERGGMQAEEEEEEEEIREKATDAFLKDFILGKRWREEEEEEGEDDEEERDGAKEERRKAAVVGGSEKGALEGVRGHYGPVRGKEEGEEGGEEGGEGNVDDEEDAAEMERMEAFESKYNFRFEQEGGTALVTYGRAVAGSARRPDDRRKAEREAQKRRKAEERLRKEEELRRLKNLKREEIRARLEKVQKVSGGGRVDASILEEEWDPAAWDAEMGKAFGEEYYEGEEEQGWVPEGEREDGGEDEGEEDGGMEGEEEEEEGEGGEGGRGEKEAKALEEKLMEELYELDYEDIIGDLPCRFKYRRVEGNDFGLTAEEILAADDGELNKFVSLKKLNPYREEEYWPKSKQRHRFREALKKKLRQEAEARAEEEEARERERERKRARRGGGKEGGKGKEREKGREGGRKEGDGVGKGPRAKTAQGMSGAGSPGQGEKGEKKKKRKRKGKRDGTALGATGEGGAGGKEKATVKLSAPRLAAYGLA
jgi:protein KRI1